MELASVKAMKKKNPEIRSNRILTSGVLEESVFTHEEIVKFRKLKKLRNKAAHMEDFDLKDMPITAYIDTALSMARKLEAQVP